MGDRYEATPAPQTGNIEAAVRAGAEATEIARRLASCTNESVNDVPIALLNHGQRVEVLRDVVAILESRQPGPRRRKGVAAFVELGSFIEHANRFKAEESTVFADPGNFTLRAVYNYHPEGPEQDKAAWCDHGATYTCPRSEQWKTWAGADDTMMLQEAFADFIDDHILDVVGPAKGAEEKDFPQPIELVELVRGLRVHTKGQFSRRVDQRTGAFELVAKLDTETSVGIPRAFLLAIPVFEAGELYRVEARIALRIVDGQPRLGFKLHRRTETERDAFDGVRAAVKQQTGLPVFAGAPERG